MAFFISSGNGKKSDTLGSLRHARFMECVTTPLTLRPQDLLLSERGTHFHALRTRLQVCH